MDSGPTLKPKVTVKLNYDRPASSSRPPSRGQMPPRAVSPTKSYVSMSNTENTFRPKAKINSSATTRKTGTSGSTVSVSSSATNTPRAGSPAKLTPRVKNCVVSPSSNVGGSTLRSPPMVASAPVTPELRRTTASPSLRTEATKSQINNGPLHHATSFSNFRPSPSVVSSSASVSSSSSPRLLSAKSTANLVERSQTSSPTPRIRSKISTVAKVAVDTPSPPQPPSPSTSSLSPSARATTSPRTRAPSVTSSINQIFPQYSHSPPPSSPPQQFYPITTAVSAANPHRFATNRPPNASRVNASPGHHVFQSFSHQPSPSQLDSSSTVSTSKRPRSAGGLGLLNGSPVTAKVDPVFVPLPPHSPPASVVSFSSRSSASRSSANALGGDSSSNSPTLQHHQNGPENLRATLDNLIQYTSSGANSATDDDDGDSGLGRGVDGEDDDGGEEHKVRAAAKSNRKIADLEITNRSLLVINASLEATKHRQAKEIHELRRKLRESRLILPPRAYKAVTSSDPTDLEDDEDEVEGLSDAEETGGDETYKRIKMILDTLLVSGKAALETKKEDFSQKGASIATKVLSPQEQRDYHGTNENDQDQDQEDDGEHIPTEEDDTLLLETAMNSKHKDIPQGSGGSDDDYNETDLSFISVGNESMASEDEVEAMTISALTPPTSPHAPPILITQPS